jgi:hypothetical protein
VQNRSQRHLADDAGIVLDRRHGGGRAGVSRGDAVMTVSR